jgi:hypothetical protein
LGTRDSAGWEAHIGIAWSIWDFLGSDGYNLFTQIHFHDFDLFGQILIVLKEIFNIPYYQAYGHDSRSKSLPISNFR